MNKQNVAFFSDEIDNMIQNEEKSLKKIEKDYSEILANLSKFEKTYSTLNDKIEEKLLSFYSFKKEKNDYMKSIIVYANRLNKYDFLIFNAQKSPSSLLSDIAVITLKILGHDNDANWNTFLDVVTDFEGFKQKLINYDIENIDEQCHKIMQSIKTKYNIGSNMASIFKAIPPEFHNLMLWMCSVFLHEERKKEIKSMKMVIKELEERKATTYITVDEFQSQLLQIETVKLKYRHKINYLKETLSRLKSQPSEKQIDQKECQDLLFGLEPIDINNFETSNRKFKDIFAFDLNFTTDEDNSAKFKTEIDRANKDSADAKIDDVSFDYENETTKDNKKFTSLNTSLNNERGIKNEKNSKLKKNLDNKKSRTRLKEVAQYEDGAIDVRSKCCLSCM